jgi:hypothetical protein
MSESNADPAGGNEPPPGAGSGPEGSLDWDDHEEEPSFVNPDDSVDGFFQYLHEQYLAYQKTIFHGPSVPRQRRVCQKLHL